MLKPLVVSLYGGPGAGKSTVGFGLAYFLKLERANVELVTEVAKDFCHEKRSVALSNQEYIFAKQLRNMRRVMDQYDVIVTDGPILLTRFYDEHHGGTDTAFHRLVEERARELGGLNYFLTRTGAYDPAGRTQTEEQASEVSHELRAMLDRLNLPYRALANDGTAVSIILEDIRRELRERRG
jgi:hypothetical protein